MEKSPLDRNDVTTQGLYIYHCRKNRDVHLSGSGNRKYEG